MSTGVCIITEPEIELDRYLQNLAAEYEVLASYLAKEQFDIFPILHCPESFVPEDARQYCPMNEDELAHMKIVVTDDFHKPEKYLPAFERGLVIVKTTQKIELTHEKDGLLSDLQELIEGLKVAVKKDLQVQLLRG
ncbi:MAG: hypothetical protein ACJAQT_002482 [Akkermansiaceae bacterium]|jgi:hypothetical protein